MKNLHYCQNAPDIFGEPCKDCREFELLGAFILEGHVRAQVRENRLSPGNPKTIYTLEGEHNGQFTAYIPYGDISRLEDAIPLQGNGIEIILHRNGTWSWDDTSGG